MLDGPATCAQTGDLHRSHRLAAGHFDHDRIALVLERGFIDRGIQIRARKIFDLGNRAIDRRALRMHVEDIHEHADLQRFAIRIRIMRGFDGDDTAIGRAQHRIRLSRNRPGRVAEELHDEDQNQPEDPRQAEPHERVNQQGNNSRDGNERPAFSRDDRMRVIHGWLLCFCKTVG